MATYTGATIYNIISENIVVDGVHTFTLTTGTSQSITNVSVKNFYGNFTYSGQSTTFDDITSDDTFMCVRIFHGNLTVNTGQTFDPPRRTRGFFIFVKGSLTNNGVISMTARGASATPPTSALQIWGNASIPATGSNGGASVNATSTGVTVYTAGLVGSSGTSRRTGGGGSGGAVCFHDVSSTGTSGAGSAGTTWSGGTGGGAIAIAGVSSRSATNGATNGGVGGNGRANTGLISTRSAGGGAGNAGGQGFKVVSASNATGVSDSAYNGVSGTGGLLLIAVLNTFTNNGSIVSEGSRGGNANDTPSATGGGSGGGSINIIYRSVSSVGTISAIGGSSGTAPNPSISAYGGAGGNGSVTHNTFSSDGVSTLPRRHLFFANNLLWYFDFSTNTWVSTNLSQESALNTFGMFDVELFALDKNKFLDLFSPNNLSNATLRTFVPN